MGDTRVGARAAALLREVVSCDPENLPPYNVRRGEREVARPILLAFPTS